MVGVPSATGVLGVAGAAKAAGVSANNRAPVARRAANACLRIFASAFSVKSLGFGLGGTTHPLPTLGTASACHQGVKGLQNFRVEGVSPGVVIVRSCTRARPRSWLS